jgi:uncharacterized protein
MSDSENFFTRAERLVARLERLFSAATEFPAAPALAWRWRRRDGRAELQAIRQFSPIALADLQHIEHQRDELERNTRQFLAGLPANNALLWGPRGTGKSSLIKALFNAYSPQGLRVIEVDRGDLVDLPTIAELVQGRAERFIVFCDDLSFDEHGF